jgi:murein DD-endopeptidase MepM/ murein hydrolase activator NlpD
MAKKHKQKSLTQRKKTEEKNFVSLFAVVVLIIFLLALAIYFLSYNGPASIYVFPENPKQGDSVFIRVKSKSNIVTGSFKEFSDATQKGQELVFYRKGKSTEWIALLGIDATQDPGNYKIYVDTGEMQILTKEIKISSAEFLSAPVVSAPSSAVTGYTNERAVNNIVNNDNPSLNKILSNFTPEPYFSRPFSSPLGSVKISGLSFGEFIKFGQQKIQHLGVDLRAPEKTKVYAVNDGKVVATLDLSNYGKTIIIDHGLGIFSLYLHLSEFEVFEGQMVKRGRAIGLSGETGYTAGPHLHFSMRVNGSRVDPLAFMQTTQKINDNFMLADISNAFLNIIK